jgi:hypothetical protein
MIPQPPPTIYKDRPWPAWLILLIGLSSAALFWLVIALDGCHPRDIYITALGAKVHKHDLYSERCIDDPRLAALAGTAIKRVIDAARDDGFLQREPERGPRICFVPGEHTCDGWFSRKVRGCAGSNAVMIGVGEWSTKDLLVHELLKWLIVSDHTAMNPYMPDREMSTDKRFLKIEAIARFTL